MAWITKLRVSIDWLVVVAIMIIIVGSGASGVTVELDTVEVESYPRMNHS